MTSISRHNWKLFGVNDPRSNFIKVQAFLKKLLFDRVLTTLLVHWFIFTRLEMLVFLENFAYVLRRIQSRMYTYWSVLKTLSNICDGPPLLSAKNCFLFSLKLSMIDVWLGSKHSYFYHHSTFFCSNIFVRHFFFFFCASFKVISWSWKDRALIHHLPWFRQREYMCFSSF